MSRDRPPLMFAKTLGALRPTCKASEDALSALDAAAPVEVTIKRARPNHRRLALYWIVAEKAADNWPMKSGRMTAQALHRETKQALGIGEWMETNKGVRIFDADSMGFSEMTEDQRAAYINGAFAFWSHRLGVDVETLLTEAKAA